MQRVARIRQRQLSYLLPLELIQNHFHGPYAYSVSDLIVSISCTYFCTVVAPLKLTDFGARFITQQRIPCMHVIRAFCDYKFDSLLVVLSVDNCVTVLTFKR